MKRNVFLSVLLLVGLSVSGYGVSRYGHPALSLASQIEPEAVCRVASKDAKGFTHRMCEVIETPQDVRHTKEARRVAPLSDAPASVMKGSLLYSGKWPDNKTQWGIYAMPARGGEWVPVTGEETYNKLDYFANGGATAMGDGHYYICTYAWQSNGDEEEITAVQGTIFDSNTWEPINYKRFQTRDKEPDLGFLATSMAYDKSTGKIYGSFYGYDEELYSFAILDTQEFKLQTVSLMEDAWSACAFDNEGNLYAMLENGDFCLVNKRTGEYTLIKKTGLACYYQTSGTINPDDNKFYFIVAQQGGSILYAIDLATGVHEEVYKFGYSLQLAGMYFGAPESSLLAPAAPSGVALNFNGTLEGELTFKLPTLSLSGEPLNGEIEYFVTLDYMDFANGKGMPGDSISMPVVVETSATHYVEVVCANDEGRGKSVNVAAFAGEEPGLPLAARNFKVVEDPGHWGRLTMTWDAPEFDSNGKPINPDNVAYWVVDNNIYSWCKDFHGNSIVVDMGDLSQKQKFDDFMLLSGIMINGRYTYNWNREGYTTTRARSFGRPYDLPWKERITYNGPEWNWVMINSPSLGHWRYWDGLETDKVTIVPLNDDGGMFLAQAATENAIMEIRGGKVNLGNAENPNLIFHIYRHPDFVNDFVAAYVFEADQQPGEFYKLFSTTAPSPEEEGWTECVVPLSDFKGKTIQISFVAVVSKTSSIVTIDEIEIRNLRDNDMGITEFSTPASLVPGRRVDFGVTVRNWGSNDIPACKVNLYCDNKLSASQDVEDIKAGESRKLVFDHYPTPLLGDSCQYFAEVVYDGDEDSDNDRSNSVTLPVKHNEYPSPESLEAEVKENNDVLLTWDEPYLKPIERLTEGFESDELAGDWYSTGWEITRSGDDKPKNGMGMISSTSAESAAGEHMLISPRLSGEAQTISLYARSAVSSEKGKLVIKVSDTGVKSEDFTELVSKTGVPALWIKHDFELPANTKYFAICHPVEDEMSGTLLIDDVVYESYGFDNLLLNGFNIYCNGSMLNEEPVSEMEYLHANGAFDGGVYNVSAVYEQGESNVSEPVEVAATGVGQISGDANGIIVATGNSYINVSGFKSEVAIYSADGSKLRDYAGSGSLRLSVAPGVYVVVADGRSCKVMVK